MTLSVLMSGCANLQRSGSSGYSHHDDDLAASRDRHAWERDLSQQELGITGSRELTDREARSVEDRSVLRKLEKQLEGKREREQYFRNKPYLKNDRERIEFLSMDSFEARARWLAAKGIDGSSTSNPPEIQALIDINDITLGMTKQAVKDSWGEPELVEVAGNPIYGNERWHYKEQLPSTEGYQTESRMVYFEGGRVAGWEKR